MCRADVELIAPPGTEILKVQAVDSDPRLYNSEVYYYVQSRVVSVNRTSGLVALRENLHPHDRSLTVNLLAFDGGSPRRSARSKLTLNVKIIAGTTSYTPSIKRAIFLCNYCICLSIDTIFNKLSQPPWHTIFNYFTKGGLVSPGRVLLSWCGWVDGKVAWIWEGGWSTVSWVPKSWHKFDKYCKTKFVTTYWRIHVLSEYMFDVSVLSKPTFYIQLYYLKVKTCYSEIP